MQVKMPFPWKKHSSKITLIFKVLCVCVYFVQKCITVLLQVAKDGALSLVLLVLI